MIRRDSGMFVLFMLAALGFFGCASPGGGLGPGTVPAGQTDERPGPSSPTPASSPEEKTEAVSPGMPAREPFPPFDLHVAADPKRIMDGKVLIIPESCFKVVLVLTRSLPPGWGSGSLTAELAGARIPLSLETEGSFLFASEEQCVRSLSALLSRESEGVVRLLGPDGTVLGTGDMIVLDTLAPPGPENIRVTDIGPHGFTVTWDLPQQAGARRGDVAVFRILDAESGAVMAETRANPPVRVAGAPRGNFLVLAVDRAGNTASSSLFQLDRVTVLGQGFGPDRGAAFLAAKRAAEEEFLGRHVQRWWAQNSPCPCPVWIFPAFDCGLPGDAEYRPEGGGVRSTVTCGCDRGDLYAWMEGENRGMQAERNQTLAVTASGLGAQVLVDLLTKKLTDRGFTLTTPDSLPPCGAAWELGVEVTPGESMPYPGISGTSCWRVDARMSFTGPGGIREIMSLQDSGLGDNRVFGSSLQRVMTQSADVNAFPVRIAQPMAERFCRLVEAKLDGK
ncbi:MAG: fibronectin type III domain-containing protein [Pseudomonadota bacterium]